MKKKYLEISIPEGYEIDKKNSTFEKIEFKPIKKKLPKSWEELTNISGAFTAGGSDILSAENMPTYHYNRDIWPTRELAKASIALAQLLQLRDVYNDGWIPNWRDNSEKYVILVIRDTLVIAFGEHVSRSLAFKTESLRDKFLENFKDLLEIAKPLL